VVKLVLREIFVFTQINSKLFLSLEKIFCLEKCLEGTFRSVNIWMSAINIFYKNAIKLKFNA